jgi:hypothetical protein
LMTEACFGTPGKVNRENALRLLRDFSENYVQ